MNTFSSTSIPLDASPEGAGLLRALSGYCWAWGAVVAHREAGGIGYPSLAELHGQRYRPIGGFSMSCLAAAYTDVERTLRSQPPLVRGLLFFQYGRPQLERSAGRSVFDYVEFVFGGDLSATERERVARAIRRVRRSWANEASASLFGKAA